MEIKWSALYLFYCKQIRIDGFDSLCFYIRQKKKTATYKNIAYNTAAGNQHRIYCKKIVAMARNQSKSIQICCLLLLHAEKKLLVLYKSYNEQWMIHQRKKQKSKICRCKLKYLFNRYFYLFPIGNWTLFSSIYGSDGSSIGVRDALAWCDAPIQLPFALPYILVVLWVAHVCNAHALQYVAYGIEQEGAAQQHTASHKHT